MPTPTKFGRHPSPRSLVILRADRHTHTPWWSQHLFRHRRTGSVPNEARCVYEAVRIPFCTQANELQRTRTLENCWHRNCKNRWFAAVNYNISSRCGTGLQWSSHRFSPQCRGVQRARRDKTSGLPPPVVPRTTPRTQPGEHARPQQRQHCFSSQHPPPAPFSILSLDRYTHSPSAMFRRHEIITLVPGFRRGTCSVRRGAGEWGGSGIIVGAVYCTARRGGGTEEKLHEIQSITHSKQPVVTTAGRVVRR